MVSQSEHSKLLNAAMLRWLDELSAQGILITDVDLRIYGWNRWLELHTNLSAEEVIGSHLLEVYPDLVTRRLDQFYRDALEGRARVLAEHGSVRDLEINFRARNGRVMTVLLSAELVTLGGGKCILTASNDITERKQVESERERMLVREQAARTTAETASRLKDEFLATVSHELRAPLNAMIGWTHLLRSGKLDDDAAARAIETVERNARAQNQLIEDLLDVSRIITGKLHLEVRPVDLREVIEAAVEIVRPAADAKGVHFQVIIDDSAGLVAGDASRLQQVAWNLFSNAVKFTPKGGRVQIRLERVDSQVTFIVSDTGEGIDPGFLPYVFDRFRQADASSSRAYGGLGLGLAIVRHVVELHGGSVHAESRGGGKGATFIVKLPLMVGRLSTIDTDISETMPQFDLVPELNGLRVLAVDDEAETREILTAMLQHYGAEVATVASASEALEILQTWSPDIIISDIGMPGEDGYELIRKVRALESDRGGQIPAVALTAYARLQDRLRVLEAGYQIHLPKPVEPAELATVVASLTGRFSL